MTPAITDTTAAQVAVDQRRVSAAVSALAPNTRKAYGSAWSAWQRWALDQGRPVLPATAGDVADYLEARHAAGASPATIRLARAAVAKVHQVSGAADPAADGLVTDVLKRIGRDGRDRGRGQVAGIGWAAAEAAASIAANGGASLAGLRDAAPYSGSCPTGCYASAKRRRCRCPTWKRQPTAGPSPSGPARQTSRATAR